MKYGLIFKMSFIIYIIFLFSMPYVTARSWADIAAALFGLAVCYQAIYLFGLRKKESIRLGKAMAQYFLYALLSLELWTILYCVRMAVCGYTPTDILGNPTSDALYGWEAVTGDGIGFFFSAVIVLAATVYQVIYAVVIFRKKTKES